MTDIELLLRHSDPARRVDVPGPQSVVGTRIYHEATTATAGTTVRTTRQRWARPVRIPVAVALASVVALIALVAVILPTVVGRSPSPTAMAFARLANNAASQPPQPTTLAPGQYFYNETEGQTLVSVQGPSGDVPGYTYYLLGTRQAWVAADGSGRLVTTTDPTPRFYTTADQKAWEEAGGPPAVILPSDIVQTQTFGPGDGTGLNGPLPLYDVSDLPTTGPALATVLGNFTGTSPQLGTLPSGISALDEVSACDTRACSVFERTVALLQGPDIGMTPALRAALYDVLSTVPGVQMLGTTTDPAGQQGLGIQLVQYQPAMTETAHCVGVGVGGGAGNPPGSASTTYQVPAETMTFTVVVDPASTTVMSSEESYAPLVQTRSGPIDCDSQPPQQPQTQEMGPNWTVALASGIVTSDTALPADPQS